MIDVTVMGAGVFGLASAWALARRGARVRVIDPGGIGAGASGGVVGALSPHVPEAWNPKKQFQLESLVMSDGWWAEVQAESGLSAGYARTGRVQPLPDDDAVVRARERSAGAQGLWGDAGRWDVVADAGGGWGLVSPTGLFVHDTLSARIAPRRALAALAGAVVARGGQVVRDGHAEGAVLWANGVAGLADMSAHLGKAMGAGVKGQAAALRLDRAASPQLFVDSLHIVPHQDGTVAIGSTSEAAFSAASETDSQLDALIAHARDLVPVLRDAPVVERWAGVRAKAVTRAPVLGAWPGRAGQFVANGGFKIGFGIAPKVGEVMADLILDGTDTIPAGFRVEDCLAKAR
jgi:glycine/D-amino acid oxidase-like deaminating enzyme